MAGLRSPANVLARGLWMACFATLLLMSAAWVPQATAQAPNFPPDFTVIAGAGGVMDTQPLRVVVIDSSGAGEFCYIAAVDRDTTVCTTTTSFFMSVADLNTLWNEIQLQGFFSLPSQFLSTTIADGTFARLTITAGGVTHAVLTQNQAVPAFDAIMTTLNSLLPAGMQLKYNAIAP